MENYISKRVYNALKTGERPLSFKVTKRVSNQHSTREYFEDGSFIVTYNNLRTFEWGTKEYGKIAVCAYPSCQ